MNELQLLHATIRGCQRCPMHRKCRAPVPGSGMLTADVMVVGQAPGKEEDAEGMPWIGQAGQFLSAMLERWGFDAHRVYFTNLAKCFPGRMVGGDAVPDEKAIAACKHWLRQEYDLVKPKLVIAVGAVSMKALGVKGGIKVNSAKVFHTEEWGPVMPVLHPAGLMRNLSDVPQFATQLAAVPGFLRGAIVPPPHGSLKITGVDA